MNTKQILVIGDNEADSNLVKNALKNSKLDNSDWSVLLAFDERDGVAKAKSEHPDVIILNLILPDLDGLTIYEVLITNLFTCSIPIIFITDISLPRIIARLEKTLAAGVIIKPFDPLELNAQIAEICN